MGLLDVLTGMRNGPRGGSGAGGGMSPIMIGLLGLLAYKAVKGFGGAAGSAAAGPGNQARDGDPLGNILARLGMGGGSPAGSATGSPDTPMGGGLGGILSGGLGDLLKQFQTAGKGDVADSWVSTNENKPITSADLGKVLTDEQIAFLTARTGLSREELLEGLAEQLPPAVDNLTPAGRLPAPQDLDRA